MIYEKVLFLYPTLVREGMVVSGNHFPDPVLYDVNHEKSYPILLTVGFVVDPEKAYWNEVDVTIDGESVLDKNHDGESNYRILQSSRPSIEQYATTVSFYLKAVKLKTPGLYMAKVSLYEGDSNGNKAQLLDEKECFFVVAGERSE